MIKGLSLLQLFNSAEFSISAKLSICLTLLENISERNQFFKIKTFRNKMSTTRSQKRRNDQQESDRNVSEGFVSPIAMENSCFPNQDVEVAGSSRPKSPRIENSFF